MEYNTERSHLMIREYGRHVQNLIAYAKGIENREIRQATVESIIQLMGQLNPHLRNVADFKHKLWDHLFMIGGFDLDVDSPYEKPTAEISKPNPADLPYPKQKIRFKHYGKNVETMVAKARAYEDPELKKGLTEVILNFMKMAYRNWSNEEVSDELIKQDLKTLSEGTLVADDQMNIESFVKSTPHTSSNNSKNRKSSNKGARNNSRNNNKRSNKRRYKN